MSGHTSREAAIAEAKAVINAIHDNQGLEAQTAAINKIIPDAKITTDEDGHIISVQRGNHD